jgi:hypothetical protein
MKYFAARSITALALVTAMGISVPAVAFADSTTTTRTPAAPSAWTTWHKTWVSYFDGLKAIRASYRASVESARATYYTALSMATTKAERQAALATFDTALTAALNARISAITGAGDPPAPPAGYNGTAYVTGIQAANVAFRASTTAAESVYAQALASATTSAQRRTARLTLEIAVGNAIVARSTALLALGAPPAHPGKATS